LAKRLSCAICHDQENREQPIPGNDIAQEIGVKKTPVTERKWGLACEWSSTHEWRVSRSHLCAIVLYVMLRSQAASVCFSKIHWKRFSEWNKNVRRIEATNAGI
jgi:hypothetical protein